MVVTFFPHPLVVLKGIEGPFYLSSPHERAALLAELRVDAVITLTFNREMAALTARQFMAMLNQSLNLNRLWVGENFALGRGREGNVSTLKRLGEEMGYQVEVISPVQMGENLISSTQIRAWLAEGAVDLAEEGLGRRYRLSGRVVHGDGRGRQMGIPTANVAVSEQRIVPAVGVYAVYGWLDGKRWPGVANIGFRPTFDSPATSPRLEVLLLDLDEDLYGQEMGVEFVARLRGEQRFPSAEALLAQIQQDKLAARKIL